MPVDTKFTIYNDKIYSSDNQDTGLFLDNGRIYATGGYTGYYIHKLGDVLYIYGPGGNTYDYIQDGRVYGTDTYLEWVEEIKLTS